MKNIFLFIFCLVAVISQTAVLGSFMKSAYIPDIALALAITLVLSETFSEAVIWIIILGFLVDSYSQMFFGATALVFTLISALFVRFLRYAEIRSRRSMFLFLFGAIVALSKILFDFFSYAIYWLWYRIGAIEMNVFTFSIDKDYLVKIFFTVLFGYFVYYIFRKTSRAIFLKPLKIGK